MRRRDFAGGLLLATATRSARAQAPAKQHRIAIVIPAGPIAAISDTGSDPIRRRLYQAFFEELRRLGDVEGQNLTIERYSGEGRRAAYADLAREIGGHNPEVIVAHTNPIALALRAAAGAIPIVWIGVDGIRSGIATSLARPGSNITGVNLYDYVVPGHLPSPRAAAGMRLWLSKGRLPRGSGGAFPRSRWRRSSVPGRHTLPSNARWWRSPRRRSASVADGPSRYARDARAAALMRPWTQEIATQQAWEAALGSDGQQGGAAGA